MFKYRDDKEMDKSKVMSFLQKKAEKEGPELYKGVPVHFRDLPEEEQKDRLSQIPFLYDMVMTAVSQLEKDEEIQETRFNASLDVLDRYFKKIDERLTDAEKRLDELEGKKP